MDGAVVVPQAEDSGGRKRLIKKLIKTSSHIQPRSQIRFFQNKLSSIKDAPPQNYDSPTGTAGSKILEILVDPQTLVVSTQTKDVMDRRRLFQIFS